MRSRLVAVVAVLLLAAIACSPSTDDPLTTTHGFPGEDVGPGNAEIAPLFSVPTADGGTFDLGEHLVEDGRPVFLNLWASWCFPCRKEMPAIDAAAAKHPEVAFVGVAVQDTEPNARSFLDEVAVGYTIGFDNTGKVDDDYQPLGLPASYLISSDGVILEQVYGEVTEETLTQKFADHFG